MTLRARPGSNGAMGAPHIIPGLSTLAHRYDALLCDVWGVVHNGREVFAGVEDALVRFRAERGPVILLTNAPRPAEIIPPQLRRLGLSDEAYDAVVTSGDATRAEMKARAPGPAYRLGPEKDEALYAGVGLETAPLEDAEFIMCTGLIDDETETPEDYQAFLAEAAGLGLSMLCANPDIVVQLGDRTIYCAGALAQLYGEMGGHVIYAGKPHPPIYNLAFRRLNEIADAPVDRRRVLAVGDGMNTDIAGANDNGLDVVFIAAGIHGAHAAGADGRLDAGRLAALFQQEGRTALAAMDRLVW